MSSMAAMEDVLLDIPPIASTVDGQSTVDALETIQEDMDAEREHTKKPAPSFRGSAKFARTRHNANSIDQFETPRVLITQQDQSDISQDDSFDEEDFQFFFGPDDEYDTDLEMDIDQWLLEDRNQITNDFTGEKTYLAACEYKGVTPVTYFIRHIEDSEVVLRFRGLGPTGCQALSRPLKKNNTIEKLDLEGNWIEMNGCTSIADMLSENIYISDLILSENRTGNDGAIALCAILIKNDNINKLDLSGNDLTDASAEAICEMLKVSFQGYCEIV
ncbi:leucine-rich repeat-containing 74A [Elysia marginata]|uniref:Leucine-rich repeat-containing 74A n=1 Tax=Elysia marginata TaxID=1093978 RepID=A0AAV4HGT6_9GAST|nr:leucine-rich repeat-containing 74A [Elysia marginata]